ncbi:glutamate rich 3-like [Hyperolius riggenbachi]|uniref:glutamate rich 3-like n=1 Tax=Hyperolius riggenbachi TaxID=752182 RepID=UPI0035A3B694
MRAASRGDHHRHPNKSPTDSFLWVEQLMEGDSALMVPLPCISLRSSSMIMDTMNFNINYSFPFVPRWRRTSFSSITGKISSPSQPVLLRSTSTYQISQSRTVCSKISPQTLKRSNVKMTFQFLGTGFSVTNEIINPKDELSMFQQICGGESICVFKGYLSPGDLFPIISRRHYGFPFSASIYINGLIAARISSCCEYRYHVGFQQGRGGCFRVIELSGGKPCYRCAELQDQKTRPSRRNSVCSRNEDTPSIQEKVPEVTDTREKVEEAAESRPEKPPDVSDSLPSTHPTPQAPPVPLTRQKRRRRVKKSARRPSKSESDSEQENKMSTANRRQRRPRDRDCRRSQKLTPDTENATEMGAGRARGCHVMPSISEDATVSSVDKEETSKGVKGSPGIAVTREDNSPGKTKWLEAADAARTNRGHNQDNDRVDAQGAPLRHSIQTIHGRLARALREDTHHSDVELSDSSDSSDILSISGTSTKEMSLPHLEQRAAAERTEEVVDGVNVLSLKTSNHAPLPPKSDQQAAAESMEVTAEVRSPEDESSVPELDQKKAEEERTEGDNEETPKTAADEEEEGLLSQISDLAAVLQESDEVHQLVLRNTGMTDRMLQQLMPAIVDSKSEMETINLNLNEISPEGVQSLVQLLRVKPSIESLLLYGNQLGDKGIKILMGGLSDILVSQQEAAALSSHDTPLLRLSELDIGGNDMDDEALKSVADYLRLDPPLKHLGLAHISVQSADAWRDLFDAVKENTNLTHLLLDENGLGDAGAREVAEVIRVNRALVTIDLDGNEIGEEGGAAIVEILTAITGTPLTTISLDDNAISEVTVSTIQGLLTANLTDQEGDQGPSVTAESEDRSTEESPM